MLKHGDETMSEPVMMGALARAIDRFARTDGDHATGIPALTLHRRHAATQPLHCIYGLGLGVIVQGGKQVMLGSKVAHYGPGQSLLATVDLPVVSHVTRATPQEPFLGMMLTLDARLILQSASEMELPPPPRDSEYQPLSIEKMNAPLLGALARLVRLLDEPALLAQLAPLVQQEIIIRLLTGPHSLYLRHLATAGSPAQQISKAITWIKQNFTQALRVDELVARAHMSPSTFRQHFRSITGMSPLQFQKQLRLQEARQLMLNRNIDASRAAALVGYESASQFSREYNRLFGAPPLRDVRRMRQTG